MGIYAAQELLQKDLSGQVIVVTGGNSGIGQSTVLQLTKQGATVIIACRRQSAGQVVANNANNQAGVKAGACVCMEMDLSSLKSIKSFTDSFTSKYSILDILVNNAGIMDCPEGKTVDGFELQFGTNHLGHFYLTNLLLPTLKKSSSPKVVVLSSCYHILTGPSNIKATIDFDDLNFEKRKYDGWVAYGQSKLANVLMARHLAQLHSDIMVVSLHPGFVDSNLLKIPSYLKCLCYPCFRGIGMITPWAGVQMSLHCILEDNSRLESGAYYSQDGSPMGVRGGMAIESKNPLVTDENSAKLWVNSLKLVGL